MGLLDEILGKLVDINLKAESDQMGVVNVKTENKTFNFNIHISDPETAKAFARELIPPELQEEIKRAARRHLESIVPTLEMVSDSTAIEVVAATTGLSALEALKVKVQGNVTTIGDVAYVKIS